MTQNEYINAQDLIDWIFSQDLDMARLETIKITPLIRQIEKLKQNEGEKKEAEGMPETEIIAEQDKMIAKLIDQNIILTEKLAQEKKNVR